MSTQKLAHTAPIFALLPNLRLFDIHSSVEIYVTHRHWTPLFLSFQNLSPTQGGSAVMAASSLKRMLEVSQNNGELSLCFSPEPPPIDAEDDEYLVQAILDHRTIGRGKKLLYLRE